MLIDRIDPEGHTILFGTGGIGKGSLVSYWVGRLIALGRVVLVLDFEGHPNEWSRRISSLGGDMSKVHIANGFTLPFTDLADDLSAEASAIEASLVVVDSIVAACITDPSQPETAAAYNRAVNTFEQPVLSLGHVTKSDETKYPFGSVFWHNHARLTWSMHADKTGLVLTNRKGNNYALQPKQNVVLGWHDGRLVSVTETARGDKIGDLAIEVLRTEPSGLRSRPITDRINSERDDALKPITRSAVTMALKRREEVGVVTCDAGVWKLAGPNARNTKVPTN